MQPTETPNRDPASIRESNLRLSLMILAVACIVVRAPSLIVNPRFWAEEGVRYFAFAWHHDWLTALIQPHLGYYSIVPNLATTLAVHLVPLEWAPLITTAIAFCIQLIPIAIILWGGDEIWHGFRRQFLAVMAVMFTLASGETWLTTIGDQFYLSLASFLVLVGNPGSPSRVKNWSYRALLACAGLNGVVSALLAPLFLIKCFTTRSREVALQFSILATCLVIQLVAAAVSLGSFGSASDRVGFVPLSALASILVVKSCVLPFLGIGAARVVSHTLFDLLDGTPAVVICVAVAASSVLIAQSWLLTAAMDRIRRLYFIGAVLILTVPAIILSIAPKNHLLLGMEGHRYFLAANVIFVLAGISSVNLDRTAFRFSRDLVVSLMVASALFMGLIYFQPALCIGPGWAEWREEVHRWRIDSSYPLEVWPPGWRMNLEPREPGNGSVGTERSTVTESRPRSSSATTTDHNSGTSVRGDS